LHATVRYAAACIRARKNTDLEKQKTKKDRECRSYPVFTADTKGGNMKIKLYRVSKLPFALCTMLLTCVLNAQTWGPDVRITTCNSPYGLTPEFTVWAGNIHVVWDDSRHGYFEIYYERSVDGGVNWTPGMRLDNDTTGSYYSTVACYDQNVHAVWTDVRTGVGELFRRRSTNNGATWEPAVALTTAGYLADNASITMQQDTIHVVWVDQRDGNYEIYYKRSIDNGMGWTPGMRLTNNASNSWSPAVRCSGSYVYVIWADDRNGDWEIYYKRSTDNGQTWGSDIRLTYSNDGARLPCLAVAGDIVHIAWSDERDGNFEIYYKKSLDNGYTWGAGMRLTNAIGTSGYPSIAVSNNDVHVAWEDDRDNWSEIYYIYSPNSGNTWEPEVRLTNVSAHSERPKISRWDNDIYVIWEDTRDSGFEIYFKHGIMPGAVEEQTPQNIEYSYLSSLLDRGGVAVTFQIPERTLVNLTIYDLTGKKIRTLANSAYELGVHTITWDGYADNGAHLASGIYFCRMQAGAFCDTEKILLLK
jgi:hypothetical protein